MLTKSRIRTNNNRLQDRKTLQSINFATLNVANKNAEKYSQLLGQKITPIAHVHNGATLWYELLAETQIV